MEEFHYHIPWKSGGARPGFHPGGTLGAGHDFLGHAALLGSGDPRRIDVRASIADPFGHWLVRTYRQRGAIPVYVVADLSASMLGLADDAKRALLAQFAALAAWSVLRTGDAFGFLGCGDAPREDLLLPATHARGAVQSLLAALPDVALSGGAGALADAGGLLGGRRALVFLLSDFHLERGLLERCLDGLARHHVVPVVCWQPREYAALPAFGLAELGDAETGRRRSVFFRPALVARWRAAFAARRKELAALFGRHRLRPFWLGERVDADALTAYFFGTPDHG